MAVIKCKMCGGDLTLTEGSTVAVCEYCGSIQTVPAADSEKKLTLFGRANRLRFACEFDKAAGVYEAIVADFPREAEAYWGLVLCKYGIEYVDDPATGKKIPTCHRSSFDSVMDDSDLELVLENADVVARRVYREEAKAIEALRQEIVEVSGKEEPYDIFICYKETSETGERTLDSVLAQDLYNALTETGYRVFFSRITLEDKLGQEYEPYIFAALHSARVMLAVGTDYEHFNAVWVKNEWSRFLKLIEAGEKKTLIPCFKNIDAYDMPKEFARLQAQDLGKVGALQDLLRGIDKLIEPRQNADAAASVLQTDQLNKSFIYNQAMDLAAKNTVQSLKAAVEKLRAIPGWQDVDSRLPELEKRLAVLQKKKKGRTVAVVISLVAVIAIAVAAYLLITDARQKQLYAQLQPFYEQGMAAMESGDYDSAKDYFKQAGGYPGAEQAKFMARGMENLILLEEEYQDVRNGSRVIQSKIEAYLGWCTEDFALAGDYPGAAESLKRAQELAAQILGTAEQGSAAEQKAPAERVSKEVVQALLTYLSENGQMEAVDMLEAFAASGELPEDVETLFAQMEEYGLMVDADAMRAYLAEQGLD